MNLKTISIIVLSLLLAGCLELEQKISVNSDGSAVFTFVYTVPEENVQAVKNYYAVSSQSSFLDREAVKRHYDGQGLELRSYRQDVKGNCRVVQVIVLARSLERALENKSFGDIAYVKKDGKIRQLLVKPPVPKDTWTGAEADALRKLADGLRFSFEIQTPTEIKSTTGFKRNSHCTVWHFSLDDSAIDIFRKVPDLSVEW